MTPAPWGWRGTVALVAPLAWLLLPSTAVIHLQQRPSFRSGAEVVSVDVSVKRGKAPVAGLTAADFEVIDNGVRQHIDSIELDAVPIDVSLVVDTSGSVMGNLGAFKGEVRTFARMLRPIDRVRVVSFGTGVKEDVPMQPATGRLNLDSIQNGGATSLNDGLLYALLWPDDVDRRHLVIALTDGEDSLSTLESAAIPEVAGRVTAVFHAVLVGGGTLNTWMQGSRQSLIDATRSTGGDVHELSRASSDFKQIINDFHASYLLRYTPQGVTRAGWHELAVKVVAPGAASYTVRSRKGYFGG